MTVITTVEPDGKVHGMTANGVASVSLDPPLALVCVGQSRNTHELIDSTGWFGISVLSRDHRAVAEYYTLDAALREHDPPAEFERRSHGPPVIRGALAAMSCQVISRQHAGDHTIFIGEAREVSTSVGEPLLYYQGKFGAFQAE